MQKGFSSQAGRDPFLRQSFSGSPLDLRGGQSPRGERVRILRVLARREAGATPRPDSRFRAVEAAQAGYPATGARATSPHLIPASPAPSSAGSVASLSPPPPESRFSHPFVLPRIGRPALPPPPPPPPSRAAAAPAAAQAPARRAAAARSPRLQARPPAGLLTGRGRSRILFLRLLHGRQCLAEPPPPAPSERASGRAGGRKAAEEEEREARGRGRGPPGGGIYKVKPHCQTCSSDCSSCCRCAAPEAAPRGPRAPAAARAQPEAEERTRTGTDTSAPGRRPLTRRPPTRPRATRLKKKKQPLAPSSPFLLLRELAPSLQLRQPRRPFLGSRAASLEFRRRRLSQYCNIGEKQVRGRLGSRGLGGWCGGGGRLGPGLFSLASFP
ncbi:hypothetical protein GHT09_016849 [Marmota monax]|uniref:Uncharacterized protein n=1 Tax=Marmota monax TaxID=9995 RepID=A0A834Q6B2_MARMO|nr:hypothetical protein GHT09_016849 [Marmota monax]